MPTPFAFQTNIGAQAHNGPFEGAAGMRFAETQQVVELKIC